MTFKTIFLALIGIAFLQGCFGPPSTRVTGILHNESGHDIKLLIYERGEVGIYDTISLPNLDTFLFGDAVWDGDIKSPGFTPGVQYRFYDSVVVVFDNEYKVAHYITNNLGTRDKFYLYSDLRNIFNEEGYEFERIRTKSVYLNLHDYYFTEADYNYAKD